MLLSPIMIFTWKQYIIKRTIPIISLSRVFRTDSVAAQFGRQSMFVLIKRFTYINLVENSASH